MPNEISNGYSADVGCNSQPGRAADFWTALAQNARAADLARLKVAIASAQRIGNEVHGRNGLNVCDAIDYLGYAADAVTSEQEP